MSDSVNIDKPYEQCSICSNLAEQEVAFQKYGHAEDNTYLPPNAHTLIAVKDFKPYSSRKLQLRRCPQCNTYYLYQTDYEFLVNGSEEEQAVQYLNRQAPT